MGYGCVVGVEIGYGPVCDVPVYLSWLRLRKSKFENNGCGLGEIYEDF